VGNKYYYEDIVDRECAKRAKRAREELSEHRIKAIKKQVRRDQARRGDRKPQ